MQFRNGDRYRSAFSLRCVFRVAARASSARGVTVIDDGKARTFVGSIHAVRAIALLSILVVHLREVELKYSHGPQFIGDWVLAANGSIDVFLVFCGLILTSLYLRKAGDRDYLKSFLYSRFTRIYPTYWFFTLLVLPLYLVLPSMVNASEGSRVDVLFSLLLLPDRNLPLVPVAWTIHHELYFYLVFALTFVLPRRAFVPLMVLWLAVLLLSVALGKDVARETQSGFARVFTNAINLNFLLGVVIGWLLHRGVRGWARTCTALGVLLMLGTTVSWQAAYGTMVIAEFWRPWLWGVPGALLLYGLMARELSTGKVFGAWLGPIGDALLSMYLSHLLVMVAAGRMWAMVGSAHPFAHTLFLAGTYALALAVGLASFRYIESPMLAWSQRFAPGAAARRAARPANVAVFHIGSLGDTLVALPALWAVRDAWPRARRLLLTKAPARAGIPVGHDIVAGSGLFDEVVLFDGDYHAYGANLSPRDRLLAAWRLLRRLRKARIDCLVYLAPSLRSRPQVARDLRFFRLAGIGHVVGADLFAGEPGVPVGEGAFQFERLRRAGLARTPFESARRDLALTADEQQRAIAWLGAHAVRSGATLVAFAPGSNLQAKLWPLERFEAVGRELMLRHDVWPIVFGGAEDVQRGDALVRAWGRGSNAAGRLSVRESAALLARCAVFIGNDTGTMHLAASCGVRCVAVFSARDLPGKWHPMGDGHTVLRAEVACAGCMKVRCDDLDRLCLRLIGTDQVLLPALALLESGSAVALPQVRAA